MVELPNDLMVLDETRDLYIYIVATILVIAFAGTIYRWWLSRRRLLNAGNAPVDHYALCVAAIADLESRLQNPTYDNRSCGTMLNEIVRRYLTLLGLKKALYLTREEVVTAMEGRIDIGYEDRLAILSMLADADKMLFADIVLPVTSLQAHLQQLSRWLTLYRQRLDEARG